MNEGRRLAIVLLSYDDRFSLMFAESVDNDILT